MTPDFRTLAAWSRFKPLQKWALSAISSGTTPWTIPEDATRILFGGDINFDPTIRNMWNLGLHRVRNRPNHLTFKQKVRRKLWHKLVQPLLSPNYCPSQMDAGFGEFALEKPANESDIIPDDFAARTRPAEVDWQRAATDWDFPFRKITSFLRSKDLVVMNLETPLTRHGRDNGLFKSDPGYASAMKRAGISVVNLSNNHIFDAGEKGFFDTLEHLRAAEVEYLGVGDDLEEARAGKIVEIDGTRLCFLSYTQFCNSRFASLAGAEPGILPLDRALIVEDIRRAKPSADLVVVSLHWGFENQPNVHPVQTEIAHASIDAGADCVIGHHPHVSHAIEAYRGCPIIYSLGNFIFAQRNHPDWADNFLCEFIVSEKQIHAVLIHPIAGRGGAVFQPEILTGNAADACLRELQVKSMIFGTRFDIREGVGHLSVGTATKPSALLASAHLSQ